MSRSRGLGHQGRFFAAQLTRGQKLLIRNPAKRVGLPVVPCEACAVLESILFLRIVLTLMARIPLCPHELGNDVVALVPFVMKDHVGLVYKNRTAFSSIASS